MGRKQHVVVNSESTCLFCGLLSWFQSDMGIPYWGFLACLCIVPFCIISSSQQWKKFIYWCTVLEHIFLSIFILYLRIYDLFHLTFPLFFEWPGVLWFSSFQGEQTQSFNQTGFLNGAPGLFLFSGLHIKPLYLLSISHQIQMCRCCISISCVINRKWLMAWLCRVAALCSGGLVG